MSSCPTAPTSTTASSRSCPSPNNPPPPPPPPSPNNPPAVPISHSRHNAPVVVIACGARGAHLREIIARRGWPAELHCLPALLHNRPEKITIHAERLATAGLARGQRVAVAYADC